MSKSKQTVAERIIELLTPSEEKDCAPTCTHSFTSEQIATELLVDKPEVDRAISFLKSRGEIVRSQRYFQASRTKTGRIYWTLPKK